ncbi:MAG: aminoglycoside phosphotransferase family protein [Deltaproteobacteria bacterium]|nr:aminoglycoside phosphotransferase family protein [Deltaproteobacteria bacterium]
MIGRYLGHLDHNDPLCGYLRDHIIPQLGVSSHHTVFRVFQSACSRHVYLYEEERSGARVIGKFHSPRRNPNLYPPKTGETEYNNLVFLRDLGLDSFPHYVVKPLGFNLAIGSVLLEEYLESDLLGKVITDAIHLGRRDRLYRKLSALAYFLASMHNRTAGDWPVNFDHSHAYMGRLLNSLIVKRDIGHDQFGELYHLREAWRYQRCMWEDRGVLVHGDVTPSNFLFGRGHNVMAIDLERMQWADRVFDLGRLCGELKHFFFQAKGDPHAAEPFIGHFLWEYCCHFPDRMSAFRSITRRTPFYMGITLLRIARNSWIDQEYRRRLVQEAKQILRALP